MEMNLIKHWIKRKQNRGIRSERQMMKKTESRLPISYHIAYKISEWPRENHSSIYDKIYFIIHKEKVCLLKHILKYCNINSKKSVTSRIFVECVSESTI